MKFHFSFFLLFCQLFFYCQVSDVGGPISIHISKSSKEIQDILLPSFNLQQRLIEDEKVSFEKSTPFRFGYVHKVHFDLDNNGTWIDVKTGRIWKISFKSENALSINIIFSKFNLPTGAHLHLYNQDTKHFVGAYTSFNNNKNNSLGTDLVKGERVVVELFEPMEALGESVLEIGEIIHGYKDINNWYPNKVNESGACNMDVICSDGIPWSNEKRSVARIVNGGSLCTGTLLNNTLEDGTPYFLTANHCGPTSMGNAVFKFNYDSPTCGSQTIANSQVPVGPNQSINGSTFISSNASSDFALLELNSAPPVNYNVYYSGWSNLNVAAQTGVSIHHPNGDVKKISFDDDPLQSTTYNGTNNNMWQIETWERSTTTEGGSSGSGLWDENHFLVGQLYGGSAACGNNGSDVYGKFSMSWTGNGSSSPNSRLKDWLDPNNSGVTQLGGLGSNTSNLSNDAAITALDYPNGTYCSSWVPVEFEVKNNGINTINSLDYDVYIDGVIYSSSGSPFQWSGNLISGGSLIIPLSSSVNVIDGSHTIEVRITYVNGQVDSDITNNIKVGSFSSFDNTSLVKLNLDFDCWGSEISWDIVEDQTGNVLWSKPQGSYQDISPNGYSITENVCLNDGCYEFIISDSYGDGMSGSQYNGCDNNGNYSLSDQWGSIDFINMSAVNADFGSQAFHTFCITNTSLSDLKSSAAYIYPNPVNQFLNINNSKDGAKLLIYDIHGKIVLHTKAYFGKVYSVETLSPGCYFVDLSYGETVERLRFIKN